MTDEYIRYSIGMEQPYKPEDGVDRCRQCSKKFVVKSLNADWRIPIVNFCSYCGARLGPFGPLDDKYAGIFPDE